MIQKGLITNYRHTMTWFHGDKHLGDADNDLQIGIHPLNKTLLYSQ